MKVGDVLEAKVQEIGVYGVFLDLGDGKGGYLRFDDDETRPKIGSNIRVKIDRIPNREGVNIICVREN